MCFADVHVEVFCRCVFQVLQDLQVTVVIHLGDLCSSSLLQALVHSSCKVPVHVRAFEARTTTCTSRLAKHQHLHVHLQMSGPMPMVCASTDVKEHLHVQVGSTGFHKSSTTGPARCQGPCPVSGPASVQAISKAQAPQRNMSSTLRTSPGFSSSFGEAPALRWLQGLATITLPSVPLHVPTQLILHDLFLQEHQVEVPACC